jgi:hypothetical protein
MPITVLRRGQFASLDLPSEIRFVELPDNDTIRPADLNNHSLTLFAPNFENRKIRKNLSLQISPSE